MAGCGGWIFEDWADFVKNLYEARPATSLIGMEDVQAFAALIFQRLRLS
jgi:hypothetical protein